MNKIQTNKSRGVIYHVFDSYKFVDETIYSLRTFRKFHPAIPATLFTNIEIKKGHQKYFENIITINVKLPKFVYKVFCLLQSPYEYSLYLDGDTEIRQPIYELFDFLDYYDFVLTRAMEFDFSVEPNEFINYIDEKHCNAGIILFRNSDASKNFLEKWFEVSRTIPFVRDFGNRKIVDYDDQMALNYLLHDVHYDEMTKMRILYLPGKIYNAVTYSFPQLKKDSQMNFIKIAHGHELFRQQLVYKIIDKLRFLKRKYLPKKKLQID
jgi:glycosyl transferase family (putative galactosyltransferase)